MSVQFFRDLNAFTEFDDVVDDRYFQETPHDWWVVVTDVSGSTKAIEEGRYRDVNTVGKNHGNI